jgi:methylmalonyl-CoA/ethylmalonyl-CoA epimerase
MIKKFDHVCMAVKDAGETAALLSKLFGFEIAESHAEPQAGFHSTLISKNDVTLELIEPVGPQGMIQRFIEKRGSALHHISLQVADLSEEITRLKQLGVQFTSEQAADIAGSKLIFIHPRSTNGLLIELIQKK